ncbi:MAG: hypothetical protein U5L04_00200 [Trueperaceae bacterium]|nr:hypothetical protein [Trueperaceae bacterium]
MTRRITRFRSFGLVVVLSLLLSGCEFFIGCGCLPPPARADAGPDQEVAVGTVVTLDGSASYSYRDEGRYRWVFTDRPETSAATLRDSDEKMATFTPDVVGVYGLELHLESDDSPG